VHHSLLERPGDEVMEWDDNPGASDASKEEDDVEIEYEEKDTSGVIEVEDDPDAKVAGDAVIDELGPAFERIMQKVSGKLNKTIMNHTGKFWLRAKQGFNLKFKALSDVSKDNDFFSLLPQQEQNVSLLVSGSFSGNANHCSRL
jgi:hypothetical protein